MDNITTLPDGQIRSYQKIFKKLYDKDLMSEYNIPYSNIIGHKEVPEFKNKKSYPGYNFDMDKFRSIMSEF